MTHPEAAHATIVSRTAHLPLRVLLELRRISVTSLSSSVHNVREEDHELQPRRAKPQRQLFEEEVPADLVQVQLPASVQEQLRQALVQWMQAMAKRIREVGGHE